MPVELFQPATPAHGFDEHRLRGPSPLTRGAEDRAQHRDERARVRAGVPRQVNQPHAGEFAIRHDAQRRAGRASSPRPYGG